MTTPREPSGEALLSARIARAYPSLSAYSAASLAVELCAIERAQRRHAVRCCSGEDGGYVRWRNRTPERDGPLALKSPHGGRIIEHDPDAEERARVRVFEAAQRWRTRLGELADLPAPGPMPQLEGDPRGPVLLVRFAGETDAAGV